MCTPSLLQNNCFSVLSTYSNNEIVETTKDVQETKTPSDFVSDPAEKTQSRRPKWERHLPPKFVMASAEESPTSLTLKVKIETTDTAEIKSLTSLVDSGATGEFIDQDYVRNNRLRSRNSLGPSLYTILMGPSIKLVQLQR